MILVDFLFRWGHLLFGIAWIGMLYYFNFVQGEYFKEATPDAKADALKKLAPRALWWFRWGAAFTLITGVYLLHVLARSQAIDGYITLGALQGTLMFLNVWLVIWPNQKIVVGLKEGDAAAAGAKALLASRTNTLFSAPMAYGMLASAHMGGAAAMPVGSGIGLGMILSLLLVLLLEANALFGKLGPLQTVKGVIHISLLLTLVLYGLPAMI